MNTARVGLGLAIMLSWTITNPTFAQQYLPPGQAGFDAGQASAGDYSGAEDGIDDMQTRSVFDNRNFMFRSDAGDGVGYLRGFQTFAAFQPIILEPDEFILWMSPRGYVTYNSGSWAGNLGAGFRYLNPGNQRILGGGFWWDHDNNGSNNYDQLGVSAEWLGNLLDFRANAYYPTNQNVHFGGQFLNGANAFIGHNIGVGRTTIFSSALRGGDFESGGALPGIGDLGLRAYAGGYYYQGPLSGGGIYGFRGRIEALVTQNLWGTVAVTHDRVFGTNVTAAATLYLGTGQAPNFFKRIPMTTRLYQQMERQYRVAVQRDVENDFILALRAGGTGGSGGPIGTPIFVDHVDNTAAAGGDGSVEHPFNHLPTTTPGNVDIVFVRRGDGTSNNMNQGITLNNFQRLLGDGVPHTFTSTAGTFVLPGFTPGPFPTITNINPGGSAVTLASHNEVSGFNIVGARLNGITGTGITDFNINHVNITNSGSAGPPAVGDGINITNAIGTGLITNSTFANNTQNGVHIISTLATGSAPLNLTVDQDAFNTNGTNGLLISNNSPSPLPNNGGQTINAVVTRSSFSANKSMGIQVSDTNSFTNLTVGDASNSALGNTFTGNHDAGIGYITAGTPANPYVPGATSTVNIFNNTINTTAAGTTAAGDGILLDLHGGQIIPSLEPRNVNVQIGHNNISSNAADGIHMNVLDTVFLPVATINANTITANGGSGINIVTTNAISSTPRIPNGLITNNIVTGNTGNGAVFTAMANTVDLWTMSGNQFNGNTLAGLAVTTSQNAVWVMNSTGDQFNNNGGNGVTLLADATASSIGTFSNPAVNGGAATPTAFTGDTMNGNTGAGMQITANSASIMNLSTNSTEIGNNKGDGITLTTNNLSTVQAGFGGTGTGNNIHDNQGNGVNMTTNNQSALTIDFDSNQITHNTKDGVLATHQGGTLLGTAKTFVAPNDPTLLTRGSIVQATFNNNVISNNGARGLDINFLAAANTTGTGYVLTNNSISSNVQEGVFLQTNSGFRTNTFVSATETAINSGVFVAPVSTVVTDAGGGSISWVDATVANDVVFVATDNTIANNGADGMLLHVGTTGYVHADIQRNRFSGNVLTDFRTDSFITGGQTPADVVTTARTATVPEVRQITLDNIARLDLRFTGNTGDSISRVSAFGATYTATATSSVKNGNSSTLGGGPVYFDRHVGLFAVEDSYGGGTGSALNDFNTFFQTNTIQGITTQSMFSTGDPTTPPFTTGGYDLAPAPSFTPPLPAFVLP